MKKAPTSAIFAALLFVVTAFASPQTAQQDGQSPAPQPQPPAAQTPAAPSSAPATDCEKSKDTCELPPEPQQPTTAPKEEQPAAPPAEVKPAPPASKPGVKKSAKHKKKKAGAPNSGARKIIVREGGTSDPDAQLTPAAPRGQAFNSRQSTDRLLAATEANLKVVSTRRLNASQQGTVEQIRMFIAQANSALKEGDLQRGHNLANKAHLLSEDLVRH